jgi:hypothetical protein
MVDWEEEGLDFSDVGSKASQFGPVKADTTYEGWLKNQSQETMEKVLGKTKAAMFAAGDLSLKDIIEQGDDGAWKVRTLADLVKSEDVAWASIWSGEDTGEPEKVMIEAGVAEGYFKSGTTGYYFRPNYGSPEEPEWGEEVYIGPGMPASTHTWAMVEMSHNQGEVYLKTPSQAGDPVYADRVPFSRYVKGSITRGEGRVGLLGSGTFGDGTVDYPASDAGGYSGGDGDYYEAGGENDQSLRHEATDRFNSFVDQIGGGFDRDSRRLEIENDSYLYHSTWDSGWQHYQETQDLADYTSAPEPELGEMIEKIAGPKPTFASFGAELGGMSEIGASEAVLMDALKSGRAQIYISHRNKHAPGLKTYTLGEYDDHGKDEAAEETVIRRLFSDFSKDYDDLIWSHTINPEGTDLSAFETALEEWEDKRISAEADWEWEHDQWEESARETMYQHFGDVFSNELWPDWIEQRLDDEEQGNEYDYIVDAIKTYTSSGYERVNGHLRYGNLSTESFSSSDNAVIEAIDDMFELIKDYGGEIGPATTFRSWPRKRLGDWLQALEDLRECFLQNRPWQDPAIMSTSWQRQFAEGWRYTSSGTYSHEGGPRSGELNWRVMFTLKGRNGASVERHSSMGTEYEVIYSRKTLWMVEKIEVFEKDRRIEVILREMTEEERRGFTGQLEPWEG